VGFGGSCFQKDILNLVYICETLGLQKVGACVQPHACRAHSPVCMPCVRCERQQHGTPAAGSYPAWESLPAS
jgi:hypothetical protein